jgi:ribose/xylose/arabinose/galactoside ABC-type transport system permease subunit
VTRRRVHLAYVAGVALALTTVPPLVAQLASTEAWRGIAAWLLR